MEHADHNMPHTMQYEEVLAQYGECITHVTGWSMEPLLHNRQSIVRVVPAEKEQLKIGDVVLYKVNDQYILHRIMKIQGGMLVIRGDNNWFLEHIPVSRVLGVMTGFWRRPEGSFVECSHWKYQLYRAGLPIWRAVRITLIRGWHLVKKVWKMMFRR